MLKLCIIILSFVALASPSAKETAKKYCRMENVCPSRSSVACIFATKPGIRCDGVLWKLDKSRILYWHNSRRNMVALGKMPRYKQARRMATMRWSKELEQMAKYNVARCKFGHDECRNTNNFPKSGQNLYSISTSRTVNDVTGLLLRGVKQWFDERIICNMNIIRRYRQTSLRIGHFTQMMKYNSDRVGCAVSIFKQNGLNRFIFACNYASNNIVGKAIYASGKAANGCKKGKNPNYRGLCSIKETFSYT